MSTSYWWQPYYSYHDEIDCFNLEISNSPIEFETGGPSMCNVIMTRKIFIFLIGKFLYFWFLENVAGDFGYHFFFCDEITYSLATQIFFSFVGEPGKKNFKILFFKCSKNADIRKMVHNFGQNFFWVRFSPKP
jgi:hypothetical protein